MRICKELCTRARANTHELCLQTYHSLCWSLSSLEMISLARSRRKIWARVEAAWFFSPDEQTVRLFLEALRACRERCTSYFVWADHWLYSHQRIDHGSTSLPRALKIWWLRWSIWQEQDQWSASLRYITVLNPQRTLLTHWLNVAQTKRST